MSILVDAKHQAFMLYRRKQVIQQHVLLHYTHSTPTNIPPPPQAHIA